MSKRQSARTSGPKRSRPTSSTPRRNGRGTLSLPAPPRGKRGVMTNRHVIVLPAWASWCITHWRRLALGLAGLGIALSYWPTLQYYAASGYIDRMCEGTGYTQVMIRRALCESEDYCTAREVGAAENIRVAMQFQDLPCTLGPPTRPDEHLARLLTQFAPDPVEPVTEPDATPVSMPSPPSVKPALTGET